MRTKRKGKRPFFKYWNDLTDQQQAALADKLGTSVEYLYQISIDHREGSPSLAKRLEKHTGIPKEKMRPDVYA